jgi:hypothetical protein
VKRIPANNALFGYTIVTVTLRGLRGTAERGVTLDYHNLGGAFEETVNTLEQAKTSISLPRKG